MSMPVSTCRLQLKMESELRTLDDPDMMGCAVGADPQPAIFWRSLRRCPEGMTCMVGQGRALVCSMITGSTLYIN